MPAIGTRSTLEVIKLVNFGAFLDGEQLGNILLPKRYLPEGCQLGDWVDVFVYLDSEDRPVATTEQPLAEVGDFAYLKVVDVNPVGAFLDWGLSKDLLVPFAEQRNENRMQEGRSYVVYIYEENASDRIIGSARLERHVASQPNYIKNGDQVDLLICERTNLGFKAIANNHCLGMIFNSDVIGRPRIGDKLKGYVKNIRPDGKLDLRLQPSGEGKIDKLAEQILASLKKEGGFLPLSDKSSPEAIYQRFNASKRAYKQSIGSLYKQRLISIEKDGIHLSSTTEQ